MKVYLISSEINNDILYKIGITRRDVKQRLKELKTGNAATLEIVNIFESKWATKIEANLHVRFSNLNINREWFSLTPEIVNDFIKICKELDETFEFLSVNNTWIIDNSILRR